MSQTKDQIFSDTESTFHGKVENLFHMCDIENKGYATPQDFFRLKDEFGLTDDEVENAFNQLDTDQDDILTMKEFTTGFVRVVVSEKKRWFAHQVFNFIDTEGNGYITKEKFIDLAETLQIELPQVDYIYSNLENISDGVIDFDNFSFNIDYIVALSALLEEMENMQEAEEKFESKRERFTELGRRCKKLWERVNHEVLLAIATIIYIADLISDVVFGVTYLRDSNIWHGVLTLLLVIISHIACSLHEMLSDMEDKRPGKKLLWILKYFLIPPPIRMFMMWKKIILMDKKSPKTKRKYMLLTTVREDMSLIELFLESIPQLCLQAYIIISTQGYITTLQILTCNISLLAASYGTVFEFNGYFVKCFVFATNIFWLFTRVVVIAMLGCIETFRPFVILIANWFIFLLLQCIEAKYDARLNFDEIITKYLMFAAKSFFFPIYSKRTFEVATFLILGKGIAFIVSAKFGTIKITTLKHISVNSTKATNFAWLSPNDTYIYQGINKTLSSKHDTSNVLLSQWEYFQPLMIVFIVFSILAILPLAVNFLLLVINSKYHFEYSGRYSQGLKRLPKLLKLKYIKKVKKLMKLKGIHNVHHLQRRFVSPPPYAANVSSQNLRMLPTIQLCYYITQLEQSEDLSIEFLLLLQSLSLVSTDVKAEINENQCNVM